MTLYNDKCRGQLHLVQPDGPPQSAITALSDAPSDPTLCQRPLPLWRYVDTLFASAGSTTRGCLHPQPSHRPPEVLSNRL
jgi:hypothetical protein